MSKNRTDRIKLVESTLVEQRNLTSDTKQRSSTKVEWSIERRDIRQGRLTRNIEMRSSEEMGTENRVQWRNKEVSDVDVKRHTKTRRELRTEKSNGDT